MQIIATNYLSEREIKKYAHGRKGFICFYDGHNTDKVSENLLLHGFERIDLREILVKSRSELREAAIEFSGELNRSAPHNNWWAIGLSRRIAMYLFSSGLAKIFLIKKVIDSGEYDSLIVFDDSIFPWVSMTDSKHKVKVNFYVKYSVMADWKNRLKNILPLGTALWLLRKIVARTKLGWALLEIKKDTLETPVVLFTLIDNNSFPATGSFRDVYLGELPNHIKKERREVFILGQLHDELSNGLISSIRRHNNPPLFLLDHFWSAGDLINVTCQALYDYFQRPPEWSPSHFMGFDVRRFLTANLRLDLQSAYADNLLNYKAAKKCLQQIHPDLFIYPYENKCIERMLLKAIAEVCPDAQKIGYQHAVLTQKHIHMFLADGESKTLPLPDKIVTNGPHTAHLLHEEGNYPDGMIVAGTALRQTSVIPKNLIKEQPPRQITKILMALAEGIEEYNKAFSFLRAIQDSNNTDRFNFRVRLHPGIPYDPFQNKNLTNRLRCTKDTTQSLLESLYWADVVLYASTSVAVQSMAMGVPVIWMDLLDFWGTDPINRDDVLRWKLTSPHEWNKVISTIEQLSQVEFNLRIDKSKKIASEYFSQEPVDVKKWLEVYA